MTMLIKTPLRARKERDQLVDLRLLLEPARDIPAAARLGPVDVGFSCPAPVATIVVANSGPPVAP
jgi:hypothetical protein